MMHSPPSARQQRTQMQPRLRSNVLLLRQSVDDAFR